MRAPFRFGAINRQILRLAIPNILSNLSVPMLSAVDTALVGRLDGDYFLGAVAVGSTLFSFIYWGFGFLRMGTTGMVAQFYGKKDHPLVILTLARAILLGLVSAFLLMMLQSPIADLSFILIDASPEVERYARSYFQIRIFAAPATLTLLAFHGWFLGIQNARFPLYLSVFVNLINIVFSILFVRILHLNSDGVAYGTVIAQYLGVGMAIFLFHKHYRHYLGKISRRAIWQLQALKRFLFINSDIFIRTLCLVFVYAFFTAKSAEFGDDILAVNSILMQLLMVVSYGIDGFAFSAESLIGKFIGSKNVSHLRAVIRNCFIWSMGIGVAISVIYFAFFQQLLFIFTDKVEWINLANDYLIWVVIAPLINGFAFIWDGIFIGATDGKTLRNTMLFCTFAIFLPTFWLTKSALLNHSLWLAMTVFMLFRGITLWIYAHRRQTGWITKTP